MNIGRTAGVIVAAAAVAAAVVIHKVNRDGSPDPGPAPSPAASPSSPVNTQPPPIGGHAPMTIIPTSLIGLEVSTIDLSAFVPKAERTSGAIAIVDDAHLVVVDGDGHFFEVTASSDQRPQITRLPTRLNINVDRQRQQVPELQQNGSLLPVRVTDLHYAQASGEVFASHSYWHPLRHCFTVRISSIPAERLRQNADSSAAWRVRHETAACIDAASTREGGGRIWPASPQSMLLTLGDFSLEPSELARLGLGSVVSVNLRTGRAQTISTGHRNPQGLTVDGRGRIWSTEHGPQGGDELNLILPGKNYGWPFVSYGTDYGTRELTLSNQQGRHEGFEKPRFVWVPSVGISNLIAVDHFHERWDGDLLALSLSAESLHRLRLDDDRVILEERIDLGVRLRDVVQAGSGGIYVWTDDASLLRILPVDPAMPIRDRITRLSPPVRDALLQCVMCHELEGTGDSVAKISLVGLYKEHFARGPDRLYSPALLAKRTQEVWWDDGELDAFLERPERVVPGTSMTFAGVADRSIRKDVIAFLKSLP